MSKFSELLQKDREYAQSKEKVNPFAMLGKAVGSAKSGSPSSPSKPTAAADGPVGPPVKTSVATPDTSMLGVSGDFSESKSAKQFQAEDQPEGYEQIHVDELKQSLDILVNSIDNKEMVGDALKKIMLDLKRYPFLVNIMHPEDCNLMVRAVRESYGVTLAKKQNRSKKRAATSKEVEDTLDILADMEINL